MKSSVRALGAAILSLGLVAGLELRILALRGGLGESTSDAATLIGWTFLEFGLLLPALAGLLWWAGTRPPAILVAVVAALPGAWLGRALSLGGGVQRRGLGDVVAFGTTLLAAFVALTLVRIGYRVLRQRLIAVPVLLGLAFALRRCNRVFQVGRYAEVHDLLFGLELALVGLAFLVFLGAEAEGRFSRRARLVVASLALIPTFLATGLLFDLPLAPGAEVRAIHGGRGFHSARLLRWHGTLDAGVGSMGEDARLLASLSEWRTLSREFEPELDRLLPERRRYNLLWISVDTLRPDRVGAYGGGDLTPNIDAIAEKGALFRRAWAQYPSTQFSHEATFRGRYPTATVLWRHIEGSAFDDDRSPSFAELLKSNGFATAAAISFTDDWLRTPIFAQALQAYDLVNPDRPGAPDVSGEHFAVSAMSALERLADQRFFLWFHLFDPHHPYTPRTGFTRGDSDRERYDGEVRYADFQVGRVMEKLAALRLDQRTIVVFDSDHGEAFGEHGAHYHASSLYDEQIRIPLVVKVPGLAPRRLDEAAENVDLYGTLQTLLGLEKRAEVQSTDLSPLIADPDRFRGRFPDLAMAELPAKGATELSVAASNLVAVVKGRWKLIRHLDSAWSELYDLEEDPGEQRDLAASRPSERLELERAMTTLLAENRRFGRSEAPEVERARRAALVRTGLDDPDAFKRAFAISQCRDQGLLELSDRLSAMVRDGVEIPELRYEAFKLLADWESPDLGELVRLLSESDNPVLRWAANRSAGSAGGKVAEALQRLRFSWSRERPGDWTEYARVLLADRYLDHRLKEEILDHLVLLPKPLARELAMHLLAGWDAAFDAAARQEIARLASPAEIEDLARARRLLTGAQELLDASRHEAALAAFRAARAALPEDSGQLSITVDVIREAIVLDARADASSEIDTAVRALARERAEGRRDFWVTTERAIDELQAYAPELGPPDDHLDVRVVGVQPEAAVWRIAWPEQEFDVEVVVENRSDRALPGGAFARGGRLRILWQNVDGGNVVYGSEAVLERGVLPGEKVRQKMRVKGPAEPGSHRARVIVNQQDGARFHRGETDASTFYLQVYPPMMPLPKGRWSAPEFLAHFRPDPGVEDCGLDAAGAWFLAVITGYDRGFVSRPFVFDGTLKESAVEVFWQSSIPDATKLVLSFLPEPGYPAVPASVIDVPCDGETRLPFVVPLPHLVGTYRLRLVVGMRQGILELMSFELR